MTRTEGFEMLSKRRGDDGAFITQQVSKVFYWTHKCSHMSL